MIAIENTLVSDEIIENVFVCDLNKCKGECCVAGDMGAPLDIDELPILDAIYEKVKPYLSKEGIEAIALQGRYLIEEGEDEYTTPLIEGRECAYTVFKKGIASCGIEQAFLNGKIDFKKPISCHLYPVRIDKCNGYDAVNYHHWNVCSPACALGKQLQVPVYAFLKEPLIRKYGKDWYDQLKYAADHLHTHSLE
jgi:hypothetical protein